MKKHLRFIVVIAALLALIGCQKQEADNDVADIWNGYESYKYSEMTVDLMAGQHINVGTVTYTMTDDAYFEATFNITGGWTMSESHLYAGDYDAMPVNKPGKPKIGRFPFKEDHNPAVTSYTYSIPVEELPHGSTGFVCAAHCVVNNPDGGNETGWGAGNRTFSDKGWSMYSDNFYQEALDIVVLYAVVQDADGNLILLHINADTHEGSIILSETIAATGQVDAVAYDPLTGDLFFVIGDTLYVINMNSDAPAEIIGTIPGAASGGTFINGNYYYLDVDPNSDNYLEIIEIQLTHNDDNSWTMIINDNFSGQMPYENINITDLASNGEIIYLIGRNDNQTPDDYLDDVINLVYFDLNSGEWTGIIPADLVGYGGQPQIAVGVDGNLYAIDVNLNGESVLRELDPTNGDHIENPADDIDVGGDDGADIIDIGPGPLK